LNFIISLFEQIVLEQKITFNKLVSGGQNGADLAGLIVAKKFGITTGGWIPKGFKTLNGPKPEYAILYGIQEHSAVTYPPRTYANVKDSDGTIRFAFDFTSAGEVLTKKAIDQYKKPYIDVDVLNPIPSQNVAGWIVENNIGVLNVAGNSEKSFSGIGIFVQEYLEDVFRLLGFNKK
jgi:hypothetical protein